ncbi:MAG: FAD-dependent oxidoreductase [Bacteroidia bacterium]
MLTQTKFHYSRKIIRIFLSEQEREEWFAAFEKHKGVFAATEPWKDSLNGQLKLPFGAGQITTAGNVYTPAFLEAVRSLLTARNAFLREKVSYEKIEVMHDEVRYDQKVSASKIIFCEGHLALNNPFIATPFVKPMKGEVLHLNIPDLKTEHVLSSGCYLMPAGEGKFICGSNYEGRRIDEQPTEEIRRELTEKVSNMINCDFEITAHVAGIRPTVYDHRPVVGVTENSRVAVFNGLGSKGILQAPLLSGLLSEELENGRPVPEEISPLRFARRAARKKQQ